MATPAALAQSRVDGAAATAEVPDAPLRLRLDDQRLDAGNRSGGAAGTRRATSIVLRAQALRARPDLETVAEGDAELRQAGLSLRADRLVYDSADDRATARGHVRIERDGNVYSGPEMQLQLQRFEGFFLQPEYHFARTDAGGRAQRVDFLDASRSVAIGATYSSCRPEDFGEPDWQLSAERVKLDFDTNTGIAEGASLRFLGVPILGAPVLSFPLSDARKSGWLPPSINLDSRSGFELGVPYYWNLAPNRDATITPVIRTRRGVGVEAEFRYLERDVEGRAMLDVLPNDRVAGRERHLWQLDHQGGWSTVPGLRYSLRGLRAGDDAYWRDFPGAMPSLLPRLLPLDAQVHSPLPFASLASAWPGSHAEAYARVQRWQVLQSTDSTGTMLAPYQREPQVGLRLRGPLPGGLAMALESEVTRFTRSDGLASTTLPTGSRWHAVGSLTRAWEGEAWWLRPRLALNAASYRADQVLGSTGSRQASRLIPTFSIDAGMVFERESHWFGRDQRQTLEPRLLYVNTPYRDQSHLPKWDTVGRDFNLVSLFSENAFTGIDRVSDAHQMTAGVSSRWLDEATGAQTLRLGVAQRFLFRDQRVTAGEITDAGLEPDGPAYTQRFSDLLLEGSTSLVPHWRFDAAMQYSADAARPLRSILGARWQPGPFRTLGATYRLARGLSEQLDVGWQWPVYRREGNTAPAPGGGRCGGVLYTVGRVNYSLKDSRITDSAFGFEYDAGCWIGRIVAERQSTGRSEAATRLMIQLELTGLSRLGSNPLKSLKDNIPGYQLLRDERSSSTSTQAAP